MDLELIQKIKNLAISAMFSDDSLMDILVLKGAGAIDLIYDVAGRSSLDLDFSMPSKFELDKLVDIKRRVKTALEITFEEAGLRVFDVSFEERLPSISPELDYFWGGYQIDFKVIDLERYEKFSSQIDSLRRNALVVGRDQRRKFTIEISKYEYCEKKEAKEIEGITVYVYPPVMIVIEKLRAICQQMPAYLETVKAKIGSARARDFFDIFIIAEHFNIDLSTKSNLELIVKVFEAKRVPLRLIGEIKNVSEFHRSNFLAVKDTVRPGFPLRDYDFYFDYVVNVCEKLKSLWEI